MQPETPDIIAKLQPILSKPLSLSKLQQQILLLQSLRYELAEASTKARESLVERRRTCLYPKDASMTELDRKTRLEADTSAYEQTADFLSKLEEIVADYIQLGRLLL